MSKVGTGRQLVAARLARAPARLKAKLGPVPVFDLPAVKFDIERAREKALKLGAEVCHVEEADGKLELIALRESRRRLSNDAD